MSVEEDLDRLEQDFQRSKAETLLAIAAVDEGQFDFPTFPTPGGPVPFVERLRRDVASYERVLEWIAKERAKLKVVDNGAP